MRQLRENTQYPPLSEEEEAQVNKAIKRGNSNEVLSSAFNVEIRREDMWRLKDTEWLNDEVFFLLLIFRSSISTLKFWEPEMEPTRNFQNVIFSTLSFILSTPKTVIIEFENGPEK